MTLRIGYVPRKVIFAVITLLVVIVFNFFLFRVLPGDPVRLLFRNPRLTAEAQERIREQFGLDKPVFVNTDALASGDLAGAFDSQFTAYLGALAQGNLGISFASREPVSQILAERVWRTVVLVLGGQTLAIIGGMFIGLVAAWKRKTLVDMSTLVIGLIAWALPTFFLGIILLILGRGVFPTGGMVTPGYNPSNMLDYWFDVGAHLILPTITLAIVETSAYLLIMRNSVIEILAEDYILTAKAKGMSSLQILRRHALKNAMLPMVTLIALTLGATVSGAIQVETVFSWPGVGRLIYDAVARQDYPVLQGAFLLLAVSVIFANLIADILYAFLDPRVQLR